MTAYSDLLTDYVDEEGAEHLDTLQESANHAIELTKTARDMADVMLSQEKTSQPNQVDLRATLERELDRADSEFPDAKVTVDGSLPSLQVQANQMLHSVFRNLLTNAVQHNDKDIPEITVSVEPHAKRVVVRIADNGPGIADEQKDEIFGKGEKGLDSAGTGLGLFLVQHLVTRYGGAVRVEDNDPAGSVFAVELLLAGEKGVVESVPNPANYSSPDS
ncbi:HAMP domain-containing sensor histidine kinase [Halodesulfurarchaeum sp. HSR-GB]|uniref:sensor histidine kinase n=1 Tax=Halodesulfurarchaeum sp. HSR-GB TaxID=3074077 RepID=UPI002855684E|nr:HAMP domain-containing sensor histidine kinase [Halodesulfurarchaeum sp. HSR-GB]MDR5657448.1 HAMP domain-containing sensor histidine kinase [Halodesulfurarchaeum sp. HSR-GB]